jgi:hypothetical protein
LVRKGVLQGSKLSPILYNLFINYLPENIECKSGNKNTRDFLYADDIAIISKTKIGMEKALRLADEHSRENNHELDVSKSAIICRKNTQFRINRCEIKNVQVFEYLGCDFDIFGIKMKSQIQKNVNKARKKWFKVERYGLLSIKGLRIGSKMILLKSIKIPTLEYCMVFSLIKKAYVDKVQQAVTGYIRRVLKLTKNSKINNTIWIANIEMRADAYARKCQVYFDKIKSLNEYTWKLSCEQETLKESRKSKLLAQLETYGSRIKVSKKIT